MLSIRVVSWSLGLFFSISFVLCVIYGLLVPPRLHGMSVLGLFLVMIGMLIQWPTIITALMFPVLIIVYYHLAKKEEVDVIERFSDEYKRYAEKTPMFIP